MKKPWLAAALNFFFMGPGTLYVGRRKAYGGALTASALALTWVELQLQDTNPVAHHVMFAAVLLMNTFFAIDGYREARQAA